MVSAEIISDCIVTTRKYGCAHPVSSCTSAMIETTDGVTSTSHYPRDNIKIGQSPVGFRLKKICDVQRLALEKGITNSIGPGILMIELGEEIHLSMGSEKNIKITTVEDIDIFKALLMAKKSDWLK